VDVTLTIQHLFFHFHRARCVWRSVQVSFKISPPLSIEHLFGNWFLRGASEAQVQNLGYSMYNLLCYLALL
jgi:hypothetical protein